MPLSVDIFNKKILSSQSRFGQYDVLLSGEAGGSEFTVRPTVNGTGVLLSGEAAGLPETIVYTTGNQTISGNKIFANDITVQGAVLVNQVIDITTTGSISGVTGEFKYLRAEGGMISGDSFDFYADDIVFSGLNLYVIDSTGIFTNRPLVNGTGVLLSGEVTQVDLSLYATTGQLNQASGNLQSQIDILNVNSIAYAIALG